MPIENPYRKASEPGRTIHQSTVSRKGGALSISSLCSKTQFLMILIGFTIITFFLHGHNADEFAIEGNALLGSLRGNAAAANNENLPMVDDPVVKADRDRHSNISPPKGAERAGAHLVSEENSLKKSLSNKKEQRITHIEEKHLEASKQGEQHEHHDAKPDISHHDKPNDHDANSDALSKAQAEAAAAKEELRHMKELHAKQAEQQKKLAEQQRVMQEHKKDGERIQQAEAAAALIAEKQAVVRQHEQEIARQEEHEHHTNLEEMQHNQPPIEGSHVVHSNSNSNSNSNENTQLPLPDHLGGEGGKQQLLDPIRLVNGGRTPNVPKNYRNPYDAKPGHRDKLVQRENKPPEKIECDGSMDPFATIPVEAFVPPKTASMKKKNEWKDKEKASVSRIQHMTIGGAKLRDAVASEVRHLEELRLELFCVEYKEEIEDPNDIGK